MLTQAHRRVLRKRYGVHVWHMEQYAGEAVFIPAGVPHQVSACLVAWRCLLG